MKNIYIYLYTLKQLQFNRLSICAAYYRKKSSQMVDYSLECCTGRKANPKSLGSN